MELVTAVLGLLALLVLVGWLWARQNITTATVYSWQTALRFTDGAFDGLLAPGRYRHLKRRTTLRIVDTRKQLVTIPGQEILTRDNINIRITLVAGFSIDDPVKALTEVANYHTDFYMRAQLVLRARISDLTLDDVLVARAAFDEILLADAQPEAEALGLSLHSLAIKDIMLPGNLKRAYAGVLEAKKEAERLLENARGETAVLRSLANSSKAYAGNPTLLQARIIQSLGSGGNSIVFAADPAQPVTVRPKGKG